MHLLSASQRYLKLLARPFGDEGGGRRAMFDVRLMRREVLRVRLLRAWSNIQEVSERRRVAASLLCAHLMSRLDAGRQGVDLRVECKMGELAAVLRDDLAFGPGLKDEITAIEAGLLYLHDNGVLILDRGKTVFRRAMTIRIYPEARPRRFTAEDYEPLKAHYSERSLQVHVIQEYARLGLRKLSDALRFVLAYFTLPRLDFIRRYFAGRREMLERATSAESYRRIVEDLRHPLQQRIVAERPDAHRLVLAGPGSGKTRVIVHRIAFLLRVLREPAQAIVVLAFNRAAAWEIRRRLHGLVGHDATGVTVLTYHGLALRLTGTSLAGLAEHGLEADFDGLLDAALALLEGKKAAAGDLDELRERLLAGYRYILVDEYQDIDARQYALIGALAGRTLKDSDAKLTLLAVGDDDQNIYAFRNTSNEFIRRFQQDYQAETEYLVENYRSTRHVIAAANRLISATTERMKLGQPIRINHERAGEPAGGRWERLDTLVQGRVHILDVPVDPRAQAECAMAEVRRLKGLDNATDWSEYAILARNRATLAPIRAWCEVEGVRYRMPDRESGQPRLHQTREGRALHALLKAKPQRRVRHTALRRWFHRRFAGRGTDNPWVSLLDQFIDEVRLTWPEIQVPSGLLIDALYEFGNEARRSERGRIVLSTVHAAKGREFRHVMILDGGDWRQATEEERRLYYVGMTRARETLTLCQSVPHPNPFTPALKGTCLCRSPLPAPRCPRPGLALRYRSLGLADVDLGYAGRQRAGSPVHRALQGLAYGSLLTLVVSTDARELRDQDNVLVGRIAKSTLLPAGEVRRVSVESIVWRSRFQTPPEYRDRLQVDGWWVVLPMLVFVE
ncbi:MAG: UvrD-helicase domain-containing protein [Gammaproteobacteria bacterium]